MQEIIVDGQQAQLFARFTEKTELVDESGRRIGYFTPQALLDDPPCEPDVLVPTDDAD